jgi:signal transduction histidine kinase
LHAAQLTEALQASRQQLVLAQEEERRRIRRDLHDGLGPILAALAMQADTAQVLLESDPATARELMATVTQQAKEVVDEVRRLVYDLRPPALDEVGLVGALVRLAHQHSSAALQIEVHAPAALPVLPAAVEVAIYRITAEALTNVVRHAHATRCTVVLELGSTVTLTVEDNGVGVGEQAVAGIGLHSIRERACEVNGTLVVVRGAIGGTRIVATMPLHIDRKEP